MDEENSKTTVKIGVFDSGVGGIAVANAVKKALPNYEVIYRQDQKHVPYGTRSPELLLKFVEPILRQLVHEGCSAIVIACTTVTTTLIEQLQHRISVPLIGSIPAFQAAAALTKSNVIGVCATPTTLASESYRMLKELYASDLKVLEPECRDWPYMLTRDPVDDIKIGDRIQTVLNQGADVIVIACTHYYWIEEKIRYLSVNKAEVIGSVDATIAELRLVLETLPASGNGA